MFFGRKTATPIPKPDTPTLAIGFALPYAAWRPKCLIEVHIHEEGASHLNFLDWKQRSQSFEDLGLCTRNGSMTLTGAGEGEAEQVPGEVVSANLFPLLGVAPMLGRTFTATAQEAERRDRVVVIGHALWKRRFGASRDAIGKTLAVDGASSQVIGVMPASFHFPSRDTELWTTDSSQFNIPRIKAYRFNDWWRVIGRLKPNVTIAQAQSEICRGSCHVGSSTG